MFNLLNLIQSIQLKRRDRIRIRQSLCLFLVGIWLQFWLYIPTDVLAQNPPANGGNSCSMIAAPLTEEEQNYAKIAWQYFLNNYQEQTGFTNSTGGYPSGTLWDMGNYLMALNAARWLNLIDQNGFDMRLNKFLTGISALKLFEDSLPHKVYQAATGEIVDYGNNPVEKGIGWSALDIGRILAAFDVIRTCHPQYTDWLKGVIAKWEVARSIKDEHLFGATVTPENETMLVQEGRLGYEEYAVRGYELWGFKAPKAGALEPFQMVDVNGVKIPVDSRDFQSTNANNYVVSESYILDGIEFGLGGYLKEYAARVLEAQKRRYESTGQLTAVTEDNIDQAPYFLYNTVYANGKAWATITEKNELYPQLRSISTKAAFGWKYLYPGHEYAQKVFDAMKGMSSPDGGGFFAGLYEETKQPNKVLTGNTNGLIMEILYYKARGNQPLIGGDRVTFAPLPSNDKPMEVVSNPPPENKQPENPPPANNPPPENKQPENPPPANNPPPENNNVVTISPIPPVDKPKSSSCPLPTRKPTVVQRRYARAAWAYFEANYDKNTGLVSDRNDVKASTLWGLGDYLIALHAAKSLDVISERQFSDRTRHLLAALGQLKLFTGELPNRGYDTRTLETVDYGANPVPEGTGWSSLDVGRILTALHILKTCHPEYSPSVDQIALDWSYLRVVRDGILYSANMIKDRNGRSSPRINPEIRLGYEEYAARAFQMWGFNANKSDVGGHYETVNIDGLDIPTKRRRRDTNSDVNQYTITNPFVLYALEFGLEPQMKDLLMPILQVQAKRYQNTGILTAAGTTSMNYKPYILHSTLVGKGEPWMPLGEDGNEYAGGRLVSTAIAFAYQALFPNDKYARELMLGVIDIYNNLVGYYDGFYEENGKSSVGFTGSTNSMILESLLYQLTNRQPIVRPNDNFDSPWWKAVKQKDSGRGLPTSIERRLKFISEGDNIYWISIN